MEKKIKIILEVIILLGVIIWIIITNTIPTIKKNIGSSDKFVNTNIYSNSFEINIDNNTNFMILLNKSNKLYHIIFLNKNSLCLYNKNIENSSSNKEFINSIVEYLILSNNLTSTSTITLTYYNNTYYNEFSKLLENTLSSNNININIIEKKSTLKQKLESLDMEYITDTDAIKQLDLYSKNITIEGDSHEKTN